MAIPSSSALFMYPVTYGRKCTVSFSVRNPKFVLQLQLDKQNIWNTFFETHKLKLEEGQQQWTAMNFLVNLTTVVYNLIGFCLVIGIIHLRGRRETTWNSRLSRDYYKCPKCCFKQHRKLKSHFPRNHTFQAACQSFSETICQIGLKSCIYMYTTNISFAEL